MQDLQEVTQETHYENYRAEKLANGDGAAPVKTGRRWVVSPSVVQHQVLQGAKNGILVFWKWSTWWHVLLRKYFGLEICVCVCVCCFSRRVVCNYFDGFCCCC